LYTIAAAKYSFLSTAPLQKYLVRSIFFLLFTSLFCNFVSFLRPMKQTKLHTAGLVVLKGRKLLLAFSKNKKAWYLPGGKVDTGETSEEAILREIAEELDLFLDPKLVKFYCHITAQAYGEHQNITMEQDCYMYELTENVSANSEIEEIGYFDLETYRQEPAQVPGVLLLFEKLRQDGLTA